MSTTEAPPAPQRGARRAHVRRADRARWSWPASTSATGWASTPRSTRAARRPARELAARAGVDERYGREWLEQQAVAGVLEVDDAGRPGGGAALPAARGAPRGRCSTPTACCTPAPMARGRHGRAAPARRDDRGVPHRRGRAVPRLRADTREGIAAFNRPMFVNQLAQEWLPGDPRPARAAAGGAGAASPTSPAGRAGRACRWPRAYPLARVDGFDSDEASIAAARALAADARRGRPGALLLQDASDEGLGGRVRPGDDLRGPPRHGPPGRGAARRAADARRGRLGDRGRRAGGRAASARPADEVERLNYGFSVLHCLAVGREDDHSACHRDGHAGATPWSGTRGRRGSRGSRSCPSSTTSGASTGCRGRRGGAPSGRCRPDGVSGSRPHGPASRRGFRPPRNGGHARAWTGSTPTPGATSAVRSAGRARARRASSSRPRSTRPPSRRGARPPRAGTARRGGLGVGVGPLARTSPSPSTTV